MAVLAAIRHYVEALSRPFVNIFDAPLALKAGWHTTLAIYCLLGVIALNALFLFVMLRHLRLIANRRSYDWPSSGSHANAANYFVFVLGSGGHTREMLLMMDNGFADFGGSHRRYLVSAGDPTSISHLKAYEDDLQSLCKEQGTNPGSFDIKIVTRTRKVHQPLWTVPWTAMSSVLAIIPALLSPPDAQHGWPNRVYSNGPATGLIVALVAHLLRLFYLVPEDRLRFVYIESWARITTLSLTGKLLYYLDLADVFTVQHTEVANRYGVDCAGEMVFGSRREA